MFCIILNQHSFNCFCVSIFCMLLIKVHTVFEMQIHFSSRQSSFFLLFSGDFFLLFPLLPFCFLLLVTFFLLGGWGVEGGVEGGGVIFFPFWRLVLCSLFLTLSQQLEFEPKVVSLEVRAPCLNGKRHRQWENGCMHKISPS